MIWRYKNDRFQKLLSKVIIKAILYAVLVSSSTCNIGNNDSTTNKVNATLSPQQLQLSQHYKNGTLNKQSVRTIDNRQGISNILTGSDTILMKLSTGAF